jgi:hypothetical protein
MFWEEQSESLPGKAGPAPAIFFLTTLDAFSLS